MRALYRDARCLRHTDLYGLAQLARIADKAEYFLHQWPAAHWPAGSHLIASGPVQAGSAGLATVKRESLSGGTWPYPRWREAQNALLAVLVPFA